MARIAIFTEPDRVWSLAAWERTIPLLKESDHKFVGIWETPAILSKHRGLMVPFWYLRIFGLQDFIFLALFALIRIGRRAISPCGRVGSFKELAKRHEAAHFACRSPNAPEVVNWLSCNKIDIVLSTSSFIIRHNTLDATRLGIINKHAALLPANKGLFPYLWARKNGTSQGVSYHLMADKIDEGPLLHQVNYPDKLDTGSMINFYRHVFNDFPKHIIIAVQACLDLDHKVYKSAIKSSYFGLPTRADVRMFRQLGGRVISLYDIIREIRET